MLIDANVMLCMFVCKNVHPLLFTRMKGKLARTYHISIQYLLPTATVNAAPDYLERSTGKQSSTSLCYIILYLSSVEHRKRLLCACCVQCCAFIQHQSTPNGTFGTIELAIFWRFPAFSENHLKLQQCAAYKWSVECYDVWNNALD